ncbi:FapA family protein [Bacillus sp. ISL-45]|uniref:FapA family protein n=1 Tax=Bacillus sp. ISL-45 TaxID=2819128 RepID=UPI001BE8C296|nr:FapA family protein [Bacillus sp. ISL-45]MBT2663866.1 FapA family protein [Bacillus sp. ISL-45]
MQSILSKGNSINDAISIGLEILGTTKENVNIEIIEHGTKGILGIGSKKAMVRLTKFGKTSSGLDFDILSDELEKAVIDLEMNKGLEDNNLDNLESERHEGKVWIKNGNIYCLSSASHFPTVTIQKGVRLYKNGIPVEEKTTIITEFDVYEIKAEDEEAASNWKVFLDEYKLKAYLHIVPGYKMVRTIPDMEPDNHINLSALERKEQSNSLTYLEVIQKLDELRVKHGFNQSEINKAMEATETATFEIATGIPAKQGKDGWVELKVDVDVQEGPKERKDGSVDFREIKSIPKVERGQVIGVIHPPIVGEPGYTVTYEPLPAKQVFPIILNAGRGVLEVDGKIVATESGRPSIERRGQLLKVSIVQKLTHKGTVDLTTGNIHFLGDVEILGEVANNMVVEAEGDINVHKTVNNALLASTGAIISYGSIIGSELSAGKNNMLVTELGHLLRLINNQVEKIISFISQLTQSPGFKSSDFSRGGLQPLIRILLEKKFKNFPPLVKKYTEAVRRGERYLEDEKWETIGTSLSNLFLSIHNEAVSLQKIYDVTEKMKHLIEFAETPVEPDSFITIPYALNSQLYCSGNILILGQGSVNTKIHAGGVLKITGVLRGGEVYGRMGVEVNESGAESAPATMIAVPEDQKIRIKKAMEGTIIKIGTSKFTFKETSYNINAYLDKDGKIVL